MGHGGPLRVFEQGSDTIRGVLCTAGSVSHARPFSLTPHLCRLTCVSGEVRRPRTTAGKPLVKLRSQRASRPACLCHPQPGVSLLGSGFPTGAPGASVEDEKRSVSVSGLGSAVVGSEDTVI